MVTTHFYYLFVAQKILAKYKKKCINDLHHNITTSAGDNSKLSQSKSLHLINLALQKLYAIYQL